MNVFVSQRFAPDENLRARALVDLLEAIPLDGGPPQGELFVPDVSKPGLVTRVLRGDTPGGTRLSPDVQRRIEVCQALLAFESGATERTGQEPQPRRITDDKGASRLVFRKWVLQEIDHALARRKRVLVVHTDEFDSEVGDGLYGDIRLIRVPESGLRELMDLLLRYGTLLEDWDQAHGPGSRRRGSATGSSENVQRVKEIRAEAWAHPVVVQLIGALREEFLRHPALVPSGAAYSGPGRKDVVADATPGLIEPRSAETPEKRVNFRDWWRARPFLRGLGSPRPGTRAASASPAPGPLWRVPTDWRAIPGLHLLLAIVSLAEILVICLSLTSLTVRGDALPTPGWELYEAARLAHLAGLPVLTLILRGQWLDVRDGGLEAIRGRGGPASWYAGLSLEGRAFTSQGVWMGKLQSLRAMHLTLLLFWGSYVVRCLRDALILLALALGGPGSPHPDLSAYVCADGAPAVNESGWISCESHQGDKTVDLSTSRRGEPWPMRLVSWGQSLAFYLTSVTLGALYLYLRYPESRPRSSRTSNVFPAILVFGSVVVIVWVVRIVISADLHAPVFKDSAFHIDSLLAQVASHGVSDLLLFATIALVASRLDSALMRVSWAVALALYLYAAVQLVGTWAEAFGTTVPWVYLAAFMGKFALFLAFQQVIVTDRLGWYFHLAQSEWPGIGSAFEAFKAAPDD